MDISTLLSQYLSDNDNGKNKLIQLRQAITEALNDEQDYASTVPEWKPVRLHMRDDKVGGGYYGDSNKPIHDLSQCMAYIKDQNEKISDQVNAGFILVSSFEQGATLTLSNEVLLFEQDGQYYRWTGVLPKVVDANSTPDLAGGIGGGKWVLVGDGSLRAQLKSTSGAEIVGLLQGGTVQKAIWYRTPEMFGAVGDGVADDTVSLQDALTWLSTGKHRKLVCDNIYRLSTAVTLSFEKNIIGCELLINGAIYPDPNIGTALKIIGACQSDFTLKVIGDGWENHVAMADYSQPTPADAQQAFIIDSCRLCSFDVQGINYAGRVIKTQKTLEQNVSFNTWQIRTEKCGQTLYMQGGDYAFGTIKTMYTAWDAYGSVFDKLTDLIIIQCEHSCSSYGDLAALYIKNCASTHIGILTIGQGIGTRAALHIDGGNSITINKLFCTQADSGLIIEGAPGGAQENTKQLTISAYYAYNIINAIKFVNAHNIDINNIHCDDVRNASIYFEGGNSSINIVGGYSRNPVKHHIYGASSASIRRLFVGHIRLYSTAGKDSSAIHFAQLTSAQTITFDSCSVSVTSPLMTLPSNNGIRLLGGHWGTTNTDKFIGSRPAVVQQVFGLSCKKTGSVIFPFGTKKGATVSINHGMLFSPLGTILSPIAAGNAFINNQFVIDSISASSVTVKYVGDTELGGEVGIRLIFDAEYDYTNTYFQ